MKKINVGIIGLGTIGSGVYKILNQRKSKIKKQYNVEINIKKCCDISEASRKRLKISKENFTKNYIDITDDTIGENGLINDKWLDVDEYEHHLPSNKIWRLWYNKINNLYLNKQ